MSNSNTNPPPYVAFYGMSRDPFGAEVDPDIFYAEPTRKQRLDVLLHLAEYGNEVMVVIGPKGSGKTTLLQQFKNNKQNNWETAHIETTEGIEERKFLKLLYQQMGLAFRGASFNELLEKMHQHFKKLHSENKLVILLIDDAEQLPVTALKKVLEMASLTNNENKPLIRVIMFGTENVKEHFKQPQLGHLANLPIRSMDLPPLSEEQTAHYILHRSLSAKFNSKEIFTEPNILKVYRDSYGWPARINEICREILIKSVPSKDQGAMPGLDSKSRSPKQLIAAAIALAVLVIVLVFQGNVSDWINKGNNLVANLSKETLQAEPATTSEPSKTPPPAMPEPETLVEKLKSRDPVYKKINGDTETIDPDKVMTEPVKTQTETGSTISGEPQPVITQTSEVAGLNVQHGNDWILLQNSEHFTLQVVAGQSVKTISDFIEEHKLQDNIALYQTLRKGKPWYGLIYGAYGNKELAVSAVEQLPPKLKRLKPWIRNFNGIQQDIGKNRLAEPKRQQPVAVSLPKVEAVNTEKPEDAVINVKRQEEWIQRQRYSYYTLQLAAAEDIESINRFIDEHNLKDSIAFYRTSRQEKPWYVLIYGIYSNESLANTAISHLPLKLQQLKPMIRQFNDIHQDIRKVRNQ